MDKQLELNEDLLFAAGACDHRKVEQLLDAGADIHFFDELSLSSNVIKAAKAD